MNDNSPTIEPTEPDNPAGPPDPEGAEVPEELIAFLEAYTPTGVASSIWRPFAPEAIDLVLKTGHPTRLRVEKDIQLLGAVLVHLVKQGRPTTVEEALSDGALLSFDAALVASAKTRENKRGILRRLQAVHRGLPWRTERRADGERQKNLVDHTEAGHLRRALAQAEVTEGCDAAAFNDAVTAARRERRGGVRTNPVDKQTWSNARRFAASLDWSLTWPTLRALITHEALDSAQPLAVLTGTYGLTRRDLDLALTRTRTLPEVPSAADHDLLRGPL